MNALVDRLIGEATAPIEKVSARFFKKAVLFFAVMSRLFVGSIFLTIALFIFVQASAGTAIAALIAGGVYLGIALICIIVASRQTSDQAAPATAESGPMTETERNPPPQKLAFSSNIDATVAPILALAAGTEIAKQLHPFSLAALAMAAGFILGRILKQRNITA